MLTTPAPPLLPHSTCVGSCPQDFEVFGTSPSISGGHISSLLPRQTVSATGLHEQSAMLMDRSVRGAGVPTNEMMRERTMQLLAERRGSLNCSPPMSPSSSSLGSTSPRRDSYPSPRPHDFPVATVAETSCSSGAGSTTTYLSTGAAINISRQALAQRITRTAVPLAIGASSMHGTATSPVPASPQSVSQTYPYPPTPPSDASVPAGLIDELDEMLSDASSPFNELEDNIPEMAIFDELLDETGMDMARGGQCASYQCGSTPLSHPPPLLRQQARSYGYDQAPMAVQNMSPAGLMHLAGNSLEPSAGGHMMVASSYPNSMPVQAGYSYQKKEDRSGKSEVFPVVALWEFLLEALYYPCYEHILRWRNKSDGHFKIVDSQSLAKLWGLYKRKRDMNFDKMSRAMRYYYDKGILEKGGSGARLEYKFGPRSNWLDFRPPPGSKAGRFFNAQPPRRSRGSRSSNSTSSAPSSMTSLPSMMVPSGTAPLRHQDAPNYYQPSYGPQRTYQTFAGIRHSPY